MTVVTEAVKKRPLNYPVLISGAGPTGLLLANLLGQAGIETLIIDKNKTESTHPKAILLDDESFRSLQNIGVAETVKQNCVMGYGARYYNEHQECFATIKSWQGEYAYPRRNSFLQPELEKILVEKISDWPSVTFMRECELTSFEQGSSQVLSSLKTQEGALDVKSQFLLACDGGRSFVRESLGIALKGFDAECDWLVIDTENDPDQDRFTKFICNYKRPAVSIPAPKGGRRYEFMVMKGDDSSQILKLKKIRELIKPFRKNLDQKDLTRSALYRFHARIAERFMEKNIFLLGDACHMTPPFAGQGMNAGLRDAQNLAWKIARVVKGHSSQKLLNSYSQERFKKVSDMIQFAVSLGDIVMPKTELDSKVMSTLWKLTNLIPEAREYVQKMKFKPKPHCTEGAFIFANKRNDEDCHAGKMIPQPQVTLENQKQVLLDELLGNGFSLVALGLDAQEALEKISHQAFRQQEFKKVILLDKKENKENISPGDLELAYLDEDISKDKAYKILHPEGRIYLVRPDRYILLDSTPKEIENDFERISRTLSL